MKQVTPSDLREALYNVRGEVRDYPGTAGVHQMLDKIHRRVRPLVFYHVKDLTQDKIDGILLISIYDIVLEGI